MPLIRISEDLKARLDELRSKSGEPIDLLLRQLLGMPRGGEVGVTWAISRLEVGESVTFPWIGEAEQRTRLKETVRKAVKRIGLNFHYSSNELGIRVTLEPDLI